MKDARRLRRRKLFGPQPWRPADEPVWIVREIGDQSGDDVEPLAADTSAELARRVQDLEISVSVIMPTWNRAVSIERAIDSALAQTYRPSEVIVVDDGSSDGTLELLDERYRDEIKAGVVKVMALEHEGVCAARNAGLELSAGEIITYLDSDNAWLPDYLAMMVSVFAEDDTAHTAYAGLRSYRNGAEASIRAKPFNRRRLLHNNFIDLNIFAHRRVLYERLGGFDRDLTRLVDWDLILRYANRYPPVFVPAIAVDYYLDDELLGNITFSEPFGDNYEKVADRHRADRRQVGADELKIAYVAWDYPALSQTFFHREVQLLVDAGFDVNVYWHSVPDAIAEIDPKVKSFPVEDADDLARLLVEHERTICHSHFIYPATALLTYPACVKAGIPFTFMPHAVDLFQHNNRRRNKLAEAANHPLCLRVFVYGDHHADFLVEQGVQRSKISYMFQAVDFAVPPAVRKRTRVKMRRPATAVVVARFIEKKGISVLLDALAQLDAGLLRVKLVGYGPLEKSLKKQADELGLNHVEFTGPIRSEAALQRLYKGADMLIVPSVVAANGDMDGFPTVILEAMAMGLPVVTTDVSAVPDYINDEVEAIVVPSADPTALADGIERLLAMDSKEVATLTRNAAGFVLDSVGTLRTVHQLLDQWQGYTVDIVLVTFDREGYRSKPEVLELIRRIEVMTTTRYRLIIVDNDSEPGFLDDILAATAAMPNVTVIARSENVMCGPSSNVGLRIGWSELAIYLCSTEAFPVKHGWERPFIDHFRDHPDAVIAGHLAVTPKSVTGRQYARRPDFDRYRHQQFALDHSRRRFRHVQGGLYAIKRSFVHEHAEFNEQIPHGGMDLELSYVAEALGQRLDEVAGVVSLTTKSRPRTVAHLDSSTTCVHPLTLEELGGLGHLSDRYARACNHCSWVGDVRESRAARRYRTHGCPSCGSSSLARMLLRVLANDPRVHRRYPMHALSFDASIDKVLGAGMFDVTTWAPTPANLDRLRTVLSERPAMVVLDGADPPDRVLRMLAESAAEAIRPGGALIAPADSLADVRDRPEVRSIEEITLADRLVQFGLTRYALCEIRRPAAAVVSERDKSRLASLLGR